MHCTRQGPGYSVSTSCVVCGAHTKLHSTGMLAK